jgi:GntR family transcriptional regulator, transcriptional repressor for pyruvate dehydrogenase complex
LRKYSPMHDQPAPDRRSAVDSTVQHIRTLISAQGMAVGDVLPSEKDLAGMFGTSRNTIREAVRTLKAYGVVESRQKVGAVITNHRRAAMMDLFSFAMGVSSDSFRDIQGFRRLTELNLGEIIVGRISPSALDQMARFNDLMVATSDPVRSAEFDFQFHQTMIEAAGNRILSEIYNMLKPVIWQLMEIGKSERSARELAAGEHAQILAAVRDGDRIAFTYHLDRHLDTGRQFLPKPSPKGKTRN